MAPNLLDRQFAQGTAPNQAWVADITYIATDEGGLYLAAVKDLFTCKIVGWAMDERMKAGLVGKALFMAVKGAQAPARIDGSFRSWQSIRQRGLSPLVNAVWHAAIDASQG